MPLNISHLAVLVIRLAHGRILAEYVLHLAIIFIFLAALFTIISPITTTNSLPRPLLRRIRHLLFLAFTVPLILHIPPHTSKTEPLRRQAHTSHHNPLVR